MVIAVNTRFLIKDKLEGIGWFTLETLKKITQQHQEHQFHFLFDRRFSEEFIFSDNITPHVLFPQSRHPMLWYIWFEHSVKRILNKIKPDIFLSTDGYIPLNLKYKSVTVIHDIAFEHYPEMVPYLTRKYYLHFFPEFAKQATRIATVSEFSKRDINRRYNIPNEKIDVVYNGSNEIYAPISFDEKIKTKKEFSKGENYFLFIGGIHPRKNLNNLLKAFDHFKEKHPSKIKLLIVGKKTWGAEQVQKTFDSMKNKDDIIFTNGIYNPYTLKRLIGSAIAVTYVSFFEGFGIPIVEAMYCNTPVITSNVSSMPEISGEAALLTDPLSVTSIADAMAKITGNENLRNELIRKGQIQCQKFSWQKSAEKLWKCVEKAK